MLLRPTIRCLALALAFTMAAAPQVFAQNTGKLTGRVTDADTGESLLGANVFLIGTGRGDATDIDGRFTVLGVPVGAYDVRISFVGYQTETRAGVEINSGYTREIEVALMVGLEVEAIVVEYERPLIQKDAIGIPKIVTAEEIVNLPVRGVNSVAAIQPGVVNVEGRDELHARGGRDQEIAYYIDGVKVISDDAFGFGGIGIPQSAIQEQEMLIGNISARYGDAMSGIINITTKAGGPDFFGSLEALTSEGLDPYGTTLFSGSLGGPLVRDRLSFFVAGEFTNAGDGHPRAVRQLRVDAAELDRLEHSPQVIPVITADGERIFVEFPGDMALGAQLPVDDTGALIVNEDGTVVASDGSVIRLPAGATPASLTPLPGWEVVDPDLFTLERDRLGNGVRRFSGTANVTYKPSRSVRIRLGGRLASARTESISQDRVVYAPGAFTELEDEQGQAFATWTHYLSANTFYQLQVDFSDRRGWTHDPRFSRNIEDLLFYGDLDHPVNVVYTRYRELALVPEMRIDPDGDTLIVDVPTFRNLFDDGQAFQGTIIHPPGGFNTGYAQFHHRQWRFNGSLTAQLGLHQLEVGGEFEQRVRRRWDIGGFLSGIVTAHSLAGWFDDAGTCTHGTCGAERAQDIDGDGQPDAVSAYAELPVQAFRGDVDYYGYDFRGLDEVGDQDILGFLDGTNVNIEPWKPRYYGGYVQDKIELRDIVLNLGFRIDVFDNNTLVYRDPFARVPIVRAEAIANRPAGIAPDYAVYFDSDTVVGYRNLDGDFFDPNGEQVPASEVALRGTPLLLDLSGGDALRRSAWEAVFEDYEPQVTFMPRVGVSFPVTDRALFFGRYGVVSQRPSAFNFASLSLLLDRDETLLPNPNLKPEQTIEYEIGFRHRLSERAAFTLSGFFRQIKDLITIRAVENAFPVLYFTAQNTDFGTVKGVELNFDLRRTRHVSLNANYTLSFADGTGSDVLTSQRNALGGFEPAHSVFPLDFDQRHRFNLSLDLRFGRGQGPRLGATYPLENIGVNVLVQAASGFPYTASTLEDVGLGGFFRTPLGAINAHRMPASNRVDLRIDRRVEVGDRAFVSFFVWIQNLLDAQNVFGVYRATGLPDEDGFRLTPAGQESITRQLRPETADEIYSHRIRDPEHYGIPRLIRLGARVTF